MSETLAASLPDALAAAAIETFESLAYFFAEQAPADEVPGDGVDGVVGVGFRGPSSGGVVLQLSGGTLEPLTANMLGVDDPPSAAQQADALGEVVNIICGNVLPRVAGSTAVFALGVPTRYPSWDAALGAFAAPGLPPALVRLDLEGGRADVAFVRSA